MTELHRRHLLNVKEVGEAGNLKFFNQLFQERLQHVVRMNSSKSNFCLYKHFHCAGFETVAGYCWSLSYSFMAAAKHGIRVSSC